MCLICLSENYQKSFLVKRKIITDFQIILRMLKTIEGALVIWWGIAAVAWLGYFLSMNNYKILLNILSYV